jgi:hypothetical protein
MVLVETPSRDTIPLRFATFTTIKNISKRNCYEHGWEKVEAVFTCQLESKVTGTVLIYR